MPAAEGPVASAVTAERPVRRLGQPVGTPVLTGVAVAAATLVLALRSPYASGSYGFCLLHQTTGLWCPLCGGLRATHDLAHGDVASAWGMNPLWVVAAPLVVAGWLLWVVRRAQGRPLGTPPAWARWTAIALVAAFGVLRNVPALAPWLAP